MKCKVCGAELKKDGELCNNCLNRLQKEEAIRGDKTPVYGFKSTFILGYEILRHCEQIGIVIFMIALILSVDLSYWKIALLVGCLFAIFGILYLFYDKFSINSVSCTIYRTKLIYITGRIRKKVKVIPFSEIEEILYNQGNAQKLFNVGTIVIKRKTINIFERNIFIESVKNVEDVFGKIKEVFK